MPRNTRLIHRGYTRHSPSLGSSHGPRISGDEPRMPTPRLLERALALLREESTRGAAAEALTRLGDGAIPALLDLIHDSDRGVGRAAAWALAQMKDRRDMRRLIRAAEWTTPYLEAPDDLASYQALMHGLVIGSPASRVAAAVALGRLGDRRAVPELIETLNGSGTLPRLACIHALGRIGDAEAVPHLEDALHDPDPLVRDFAAAALEEIGMGG
jgi:HEAT repeat protein